MAQQTTISNTSVARERAVMAIACQGGTAALRDALCKAFSRQIPDMVAGYVIRRMPDLDAAPTRPADVRVRVVAQPQADTLRLHLEWYTGVQARADRGPTIEVTRPAQDTPGALVKTAKALLKYTPDFTARLGR